MKKGMNKIGYVLLINIVVAVAFGLFLFLITKSAELGLMLGISLFIVSLRVFHPLRFRMITEQVEKEATEQVQDQHASRPLETAGIILFGLALGTLTFLLLHRPWPAVLVSFCFMAPVLFLRAKRADTMKPDGNTQQKDKVEQ